MLVGYIRCGTDCEFMYCLLMSGLESADSCPEYRGLFASGRLLLELEEELDEGRELGVPGGTEGAVLFLQYSSILFLRRLGQELIISKNSNVRSVSSSCVRLGSM